MDFLKRRSGGFSALAGRGMLVCGIVLFTCQVAFGQVSESSDVKTVSEILVDEDKDGKLDLLGEKVKVAGRANVSNSTYHNRYLMVYIQDESRGVLVFSDNLKKTINKGDSLMVEGTLELYFDKPEVVVENLEVVETEPRVPVPVSLDKVYDTPERYLGLLVEGEGIITSKDTGTSTKRLTISPSDTSDLSLTVYVSRFHNYRDDFDFDVLSIGDRINVKGVMEKFIYEDSGKIIYEVLPRTPQDIEYRDIPQRYLNILLLGSGFLALIIVGWIVSLRKQVKSQTRELSMALEEKEAMMKEIHHRVKNNLSMVSSLFDLQMSSTDSSKVHEVLRDGQSRIQTMALIHDKLYQTGSYSEVRLDEYIKELAKEVHRAFYHLKQSVELRFSIEPVEVHVDKAVTCGLLVNELIVNAFKHAFSKMEQGEGILKIGLEEEGNTAILTVADNGPGLPEDFGADSSGSLGSDLISAFSAQLEAELNIEREKEGAVFVFRFPID